MLLEVTGLIIFNLRLYIDETPLLLDPISIAKRAAICRLPLRSLLNRKRVRVRLNNRWQVAARKSVNKSILPARKTTCIARLFGQNDGQVQPGSATPGTSNVLAERCTELVLLRW